MKFTFAPAIFALAVTVILVMASQPTSIPTATAVALPAIAQDSVPAKQKIATVSAPVKMQAMFTVDLDDTLVTTMPIGVDSTFRIKHIDWHVGHCDSTDSWVKFFMYGIFEYPVSWELEREDGYRIRDTVFSGNMFTIDSLASGMRYWITALDAQDRMAQDDMSILIPCIPVCPKSETKLDSTTCDSSKAGVFVQNLTNWLGCDSIVTTTVTLLSDADTTLIPTPVCDSLQNGKELWKSWSGFTPQFPCGHWTIKIGVYTPIEIALDTLSVTCPPMGGNDGEVSIVVISGKGPFTYEWGGSGQTTATCSGLAPGTYSATVTDANGCKDTVVATLAPPYCPPVIPPVDTILYLATCFADSASISVDTLLGSLGQDSIVTTIVSFDSTLVPVIEVVNFKHPTTMWNGEIEVTASGGTSPYSYLWDNGEQNELISGLDGGVYNVTVTDANGCPASLRVPLCDFWASSMIAGQAIIHYGPADDELVEMFGGEVGELIVTGINGQVLLQETINLRDEISRQIQTSYQGAAVASLKLPNGKFLVCKFVIL